MTVPPWRKCVDHERDGSRIMLKLECGHPRVFTPHGEYEEIKEALLVSTFPCVECGRVGEGGE